MKTILLFLCIIFISTCAWSAPAKLNQKDWACRRLEPFGIRQINWEKTLVDSNNVLRINNSTSMRIHCIYTNLLVKGNINIKTTLYGGTYIGFFSKEIEKGIIGTAISRKLATNSFEVVRQDGKILITVNNRKMPVKKNILTEAGKDMYFGIIVNPKSKLSILDLSVKTDAAMTNAVPALVSTNQNLQISSPKK